MATRSETKVIATARKGVLRNPVGYPLVRDEIVVLLQAARQAAARTVNALMTATYWEIGRRIVEFEQGGEARAGYGETLIQRLADDLSRQFGRGFSRQNLQQMRQFYLCWPIIQTLSEQLLAGEICQTLSGKFEELTICQMPSGNFTTLASIASRFPLPWSAYVRLLSVKNEHARAFYETETLRCGWSVRQLDRQITSQFYERTAMSKNKASSHSGSRCREVVQACERTIPDFL